MLNIKLSPVMHVNVVLHAKSSVPLKKTMQCLDKIISYAIKKKLHEYPEHNWCVCEIIK